MKSCPFCKSERVGLYANMVSGVTFGQCMNCGAQGPLCSTSDSAEVGPIKKWDQWSDEALRESVRRLVGEWKKKEATTRMIAKRFNDSNRFRDSDRLYEQADIYAACGLELSALIDGKGENDG